MPQKGKKKSARKRELREENLAATCPLRDLMKKFGKREKKGISRIRASSRK